MHNTDQPSRPGLDDEVHLSQMLALGVTYRQLDYWVRKGYLTPAVVDGSGPGNPRHWTGREHRIVELMLRLMRSGVEVSYAARMARDAVDQRVTRVTTDQGVTITWHAA